MRNRLIQLGLGLFWLVSLEAHAEGPVTFQACFQAALKQSETLADQQERIVQAEEHYRQALGSALPNVSLSGSFLRQADNPSGSSADQNLWKVSLSQPLFQGLREFAALRQTADLITYQKESWQWAGLQLYSDVSRSYFTVLSIETDLAHVDAQIQLYDQRLHDLDQRVRIGRSRPTEVLTVRSAQANLRAQRQQIQGQLNVARQVLSFLTGKDTGTPLQAAEPLPARIDPLEVYLGLIEKRPDVLAARKYLASAQENVALAQGARLPSIVASANYYPVRPDFLEEVAWDAQIALTLPIFQGGVLVSKVSEAESQAKQSELALQRLLRFNHQEMSNTWTEVRSDLDQVKAFEEAAVLSHQAYLANLQDYNLGLVTILDVLQTLTADLDIQRALDRTKYATLIDHYHLEATAARPLELLGGE